MEQKAKRVDEPSPGMRPYRVIPFHHKQFSKQKMMEKKDLSFLHGTVLNFDF
jgi:hypothetical protein